jgi:hypothetical protein
MTSIPQHAVANGNGHREFRRPQSATFRLIHPVIASRRLV